MQSRGCLLKPTTMTATTEPTSDPVTGNRARVRRYRDKHRRIEYIPSPDVLAMIEAWRARELDNCTSGVIDRLLRAGSKALTK